MTIIKESGIVILNSYFHPSLQEHHLKYQENQSKKRILASDTRLIMRRPMQQVINWLS